jgi:hypothetical protein
MRLASELPNARGRYWLLLPRALAGRLAAEEARR